MLEQYQVIHKPEAVHDESMICLEVGEEDEWQEFIEIYQELIEKKFPKIQEKETLEAGGALRKYHGIRMWICLWDTLNEMCQTPTFFLVPAVLGCWQWNLSLCDSRGAT